MLNAGRAHRRAGIDRSPPGAAGVAFVFDKFLELLQVRLRLAVNDMELVAQLFHQAFGLVFQAQPDGGLAAPNVIELHHAGVGGAFRSGPGHSAVGYLFQDLRLPLPADAADFSHPLQPVVAELGHALDAAHEVREVLELGPLVVSGAHRYVHQNAFFHLRAHNVSFALLPETNDSGRIISMLSNIPFDRGCFQSPTWACGETDDDGTRQVPPSRFCATHECQSRCRPASARFWMTARPNCAASLVETVGASSTGSRTKGGSIFRSENAAPWFRCSPPPAKCSHAWAASPASCSRAAA